MLPVVVEGRLANFAGRKFSREEVRLISDVVYDFPRLSRWELASTVCELLNWRRPSARLKARECLDLLQCLHKSGILTLPPKRQGRPPSSPNSIILSRRSAPSKTLEGKIDDIRPLQLHLIGNRAERDLWRELVHRHHYLRSSTPFGAHLRYLIKAVNSKQLTLGCIQYSSPAWRIGVRDHWIGWSEAARKQNLQRIISQSRFLILPWVQIPNLASHALAQSLRTVGDDWTTRFGLRPLLVETYVEENRFAGTCYRASNWIEVGLTKGRGRMDRKHEHHGTPKRVFLYPLTKDAVDLLCQKTSLNSRPNAGQERKGTEYV